MHTILLMYRSVVLAAATPDVSAGCGGSGGSSRGGDPFLDFTVDTVDGLGHTLVVAGIRGHGTNDTDAGTTDNISPNLLQAKASVADIEWVEAKARADAQAAAAAAKKGIGTASEVGLESSGDAEGNRKPTVELTGEQLKIACDMAEQLDTEVRER